MTTAVYTDQFLQSALDASAGDLEGILDTNSVLSAAGDEELARQAVSLLRANGWITAVTTQVDGFVTLVRLTPAGLTEARRLRRESTRRAARESHAQNALLHWVYETDCVVGEDSARPLSLTHHDSVTLPRDVPFP